MSNCSAQLHKNAIKQAFISILLMKYAYCIDITDKVGAKI